MQSIRIRFTVSTGRSQNTRKWRNSGIMNPLLRTFCSLRELYVKPFNNVYIYVVNSTGNMPEVQARVAGLAETFDPSVLN